MPAGVDRGAGLQLHNQIYFELMAFELCSSKAVFFQKDGVTSLRVYFHERGGRDTLSHSLFITTCWITASR